MNKETKIYTSGNKNELQRNKNKHQGIKIIYGTNFLKKWNKSFLMQEQKAIHLGTKMNFTGKKFKHQGTK
jgi:hypothetical protein